MISENTLTVLHELIQTSEDSRNGLALATKAAIRPELKSLFHVLSIDRSAAAAELQSVLHCLGIASNDPDITGNAHGRCMRGQKVGDTDVAMLDDVDHSEQDANAKYARALTIELPLCIRRIVQRQYDDAVRNHDLIRGLRSSYRTVTGAVSGQRR